MYIEHPQYIAVSASVTLFSHYAFTPFISCSSMLESVQFLADIQQLHLTIAFSRLVNKENMLSHLL